MSNLNTTAEIQLLLHANVHFIYSCASTYQEGMDIRMFKVTGMVGL